MQIFFLDTISSVWYDVNGEEFSSNMPSVAFGSQEEITIIAVTGSPGAGTENVAPELDWIRDSRWAGCSAVIGVDNDYIHRLKGTLSGGLGAGAVNSVTAVIPGATSALIPSSGTIRLLDESDNSETLTYSERIVSGNSVTFTVSGSISGFYSDGSRIDCPQSPYCSALMNAEKSKPGDGIFVFDLVVDSLRLREEMLYKSTESLPVVGMELLFFRMTENAAVPVRAFLLDTFAITGTINSTNLPDISDNIPDDEIHNRVVTVVYSIVAAGDEVQLSEDAVSWFNIDEYKDVIIPLFFRYRNAAAKGAWSPAVPLPVGAPGTDGKNGVTYTPSVDSEGNLSWTNDGGLENPPTVNIKGPQGEPGIGGGEGSGAVFIPSVDSDGNLSWTNNGGLENPPTVNIKGPQGEPGEDGKTPQKGTDYWTESDKEEMVNDVLAALPTWDGGTF